MERRKSTRFRLHCQVTCTWRDDDGVVNTIHGAAQNISAGGLFISSQGRPWVGLFTSVEIQLPSRAPLRQQLHLHGMARVVRVIQDGDRSGFAVAGSPAWTIARSRARAEATAV